jgi:hypothetical protein
MFLKKRKDISVALQVKYVLIEIEMEICISRARVGGWGVGKSWKGWHAGLM